jgi:hypothetical protein
LRSGSGKSLSIKRRITCAAFENAIMAGSASGGGAWIKRSRGIAEISADKPISLNPRPGRECGYMKETI